MRRFTALTLVVLMLPACGRLAQNETDEKFTDPDGLPIRACGFRFDRETDTATLQTELQKLAGLWVSDTAGYTSAELNGTTVYEKPGFRFDFVGKVHGEVRFQFDNQITPALVNVTAPTVTYTQVVLSKPLANYRGGAYRVVELHKAGPASTQSCRTHLFKKVDDDTLVITPGQVRFVAGDALQPTILEYLNDTPNPDAHKYLRRQ